MSVFLTGPNIYSKLKPSADVLSPRVKAKVTATTKKCQYTRDTSNLYCPLFSF